MFQPVEREGRGGKRSAIDGGIAGPGHAAEDRFHDAGRAGTQISSDDDALVLAAQFTGGFEELEKATRVGVGDPIGQFGHEAARTAGAELYAALVHQGLYRFRHVAGAIPIREETVYLKAMPASRIVREMTPRALFARLAGCVVCKLLLVMQLAAASAVERQVTRGPGGRILTNTGVWSPESRWIVYDTRSDAAGDLFDGTTIEMVQVETGEVRRLYEARNGARCGVATFHPQEQKVVFILGPENPTPDWSYNAFHRQGVMVEVANPGRPRNLDARDLAPPFTPGALRGGSHVHVWDAKGDWVSFTYEDHVLAGIKELNPQADINQRNVGVCVPGRPVRVNPDHPRNHDGECFTVLVTRTVTSPVAGSDEILKACEEGWVGTEGYLRPDGTRQRRALAFQGHVVTAGGATIAEVFIADLPDDLTRPGVGPLEGTSSRRPAPPEGATQRRLTFTADRTYPGIQGPRHWLRASPDGSRIAYLAKDDGGVVQLWTVSPNGGAPRQLSRNERPIASSFTWHPDGRRIAHVLDGSVCLTDAGTGVTTRLTARDEGKGGIRPEACVCSPDGRWIAFVRQVGGGLGTNQICVVGIPHQ